MVRYKVKADRAAENEKFVAGVFEELQRARPGGLHYAAFKLDDGVSFVHVVSEEIGGSFRLSELPAFKAFTAALRDRCEEPPVVTPLNEVGSHKFFDT
jgi:hypothetical protein